VPRSGSRKNESACGRSCPTTPETMKKPVQQQRPCDQQVGGIASTLRIDCREEQRVELAVYQNHALTHGAPISAKMTILALLQLAKASGQRAFEPLPSSSFLEHRRFVEPQPDPDRDCQAGKPDTRNGNAPAPGGEIGFADCRCG